MNQTSHSLSTQTDQEEEEKEPEEGEDQPAEEAEQPTEEQLRKPLPKEDYSKTEEGDVHL